MRHLFAIIVVVIIGVYLVGRYSTTPIIQTNSHASTSSTPYFDPEANKRAAEHLSVIKKYQLRKTSDVMVVGDFTISNPSDYDLKDFVLRCEHFAPSGTNVDYSQKTIFEIIPARTTKTFRNFHLGFIHSQAVRNRCWIKNATAVMYRAPPQNKSSAKLK
jgi:hypothetical protein